MASDTNGLEEQLLAQLATVVEPEYERDLVSLNMIRDLTIADDTARFSITLITPAYPHKEQLESKAHDAVLSIDGIESVESTFIVEIPTNGKILSQLNLPIKNLIAISSGKGGVGKSTLAANIAIALQQFGASVGLMDSDILGPNLPMMMGVEGVPPPVGDRLTPAVAYDIKLISMGFLVVAEEPIVWRGPMLHNAIRQFFTNVEWGELDYMIIDLPPGTGDAQLTLAQTVPLTGAVIVTQPQEVAVGDALRGLAMFEKLNVPIIGVVENMSGDFFGEGGGQALAEMQNVPYLGSVPLNPQVRVGGDSGKPIVTSHPDSDAAVALRKISQAIAMRAGIITIEQDQATIPLTTIG